MSTNSVALQSLTVTYTDSEGEEDDRTKRRSTSVNSDNVYDAQVDSKDEKESQLTQNTSPDSTKSGTNTPKSGSSISGK